MERIIEIIRNNISEIQKLSSFNNWIVDKRINDDDIIVINNSFVHREESKTSKNQKYLAYAVRKEYEFNALYAFSERRIINDFKLYKKEKIINNLTEISEVIKNELSTLGELVFILLGTIDENISFSQSLDTNFIKTIIYNPTFKENKIEGENLLINDTSDDEEIWNLINSIFSTGEFAQDLTADLKINIGKKLDEIEDESYSRLILKSDLSTGSPTIIESMLTILKEQLSEYSKSLTEFSDSQKEDSQIFNNILRIAYNFSSDASTLLKLIISICDLKPIILWGTIFHHYKLSEAFKELPWNRSNYKPSMKNYNDIIANSRNQAFHKIFPFKNSLNISLPNNSLKGATIKIFSKHSKKKENQLNYEDKAMVDVLLDFTRTSEHKTVYSFWEQNKNIMELSIKLIEETNNFLKLLYTYKV